MQTSFLTPQEWLSDSRIVAGIMTGTSLDAIDTAIVQFKQDDNNSHNLKLLAKSSTPYDFNLKQSILDLISKETTIKQVSKTAL